MAGQASTTKPAAPRVAPPVIETEESSESGRFPRADPDPPAGAREAGLYGGTVAVQADVSPDSKPSSKMSGPSPEQVARTVFNISSRSAAAWTSHG